MVKASGLLITCLAALGVSVAEAQYVPANMNFDGTLIDASNNPITSASVTIKFELLDDAATCVLYSEMHTGLNLSSTAGAFSIKIGNGSSKQNFLESSTSFTTNLFLNTGVPTGAFTGCAPGVTMAPGQGRKLRVSYDIGGGLTALTPDYDLSAVPHAMVAETLQGKSASDLLQVRDDVGTDLNQTNLESVFSATNYAKLLQLLNGTFTAAYSFNNQRLINVATPTAATDATNKSYVDSNIGGSVADMTGVGPATGDGKTLIWDQAQNKWVTGTLAIGASGVTPGTYGSASQIPTFTVGTDGRITAASNVAPAFNPNVLTQAGTSNGNVLAWNGSAWVPQAPGGAITALTGDVSASGVGSVAATLANNSVTAAKILNDAVSSAKIDNAGIATNRLVSSDPTTGTTLRFVGCALNEVMQFDAAGKWVCRSVATAIGYTPVNLAGDSMTGSLSLPADGLTVGTSQLVVAGGNVGVGIASPTSRLHVDNPSGITIFANSGNSNAIYATSAGTNATIDGANSTPSGVGVYGHNSSSGTGVIAHSVSGVPFKAWVGGGGTEVFRIDNSGKVGINTSAPWSFLTVVSDGSAPTIAAENFSNTGTTMPTIELHRGRGTAGAPSDVMTGDKLGAIGFHGFAASFSSIPGARISAKATENWTGSAHGTDIVFETAPNGSGVLNPNMIITQNGNVGIGTTFPNVSLDLGMKTDAIQLPKGTTGQRPGGAPGMFRYNTTNNDLEFHNGSAWISMAKPQTVTFAGNYIDSGITPGTTYYAPVQGSSIVNGGVQWTTDAFERRTVLNRGGTLKNLYVKMSQAPTADWVFTILINGTPSGLTCTVFQPAGTFCSMVGGSGVAPGDMISIRIDTAGATGAAKASWAVDLEFP